MDADGANDTLLLREVNVRQPAWSPDGRFLAFWASKELLGCPPNAARGGSGIGLLELIDAATNTWSGPIQLLCKPLGTATPSFGPIINSGYRLAYFDRKVNPDGSIADREDLFVVDFQITNGGNGYAGN